MKVIHIIGKKNNGKTTLITDLVKELTSRGIRVGTIKHCGHRHELDTPGKDSFLYREAGASSVIILAPNLTAMFMEPKEEDYSYSSLKMAFANCDIVLVEGHSLGPGPNIEVWRKDVGTSPLALEREDILGIVTDDPADESLTRWSRSDVAELADVVLDLAEEV